MASEPCKCLTLTYFDAKGRAEPLRWVLAQAGKKYTDKRVTADEWKELKPKTPTGELPYLTVDGVDLPESGAIFHYLAAECCLNGCNNMEAAQIHVIWDQLESFMKCVYDIFFAKDDECKEKAKVKKNEVGAKLLKCLEKRLCDGKEWLVGCKLTAADLAVACRLCDAKCETEELLKEAPAVQALIKRVHCLPNIKKWVECRPDTQY